MILVLLLLLLFPAAALATENTEEETDAADLTDTAELEAMLATLDEQYAPFTEDFSLMETWDRLQSGEGDSLLSSLVTLLCSLLFGEIVSSGSVLAYIMILAVLALLLTVIKDSFSGGQIATLSQWIVSLLLISLSISIFSQAMVSARDTVDLIRDLLFVLLPILLPLLAALGGITTVALLSPALIFALNVLMALIKNVVFPLIWFFAVLRLVSTLAPRFPINKLAGLCKDVALGAMSITTTLFISFMSLSGIASAVRDGVTVKAAKTASGAFIPVVGRTLADTLDSVLGTVLVLKGAVGSIGALALLLICAIPAAQILAQALLFRIAGALVQPLGENTLAEALSDMGNSLILLFAALAVSSLFAFFALALVVGMGSVTMMMR